MYAPLYIKTDNSLLESLISISDLVEYAKVNNIKALTITDNRMYGVMDFYHACIDNNIKPIIGLEVVMDKRIVLYAKTSIGYKNLLKLSTIQSERVLTIDDLKKYNTDLICILPFLSNDLYDEYKSIYKDIYKSYRTKEERDTIKEEKVYLNETLYLNKSDSEYINYVYAIKKGTLVSNIKLDIKNNFIVKEEVLEKHFREDLETNKKIVDMCNVEINYTSDLLPNYECPNNDQYAYLKKLCIEGLKNKFGNTVSKVYQDRLKYELDIINKMGFCNYFLVVYDFIKYAKENNIYIGPGRGSAASSLVSYLLNITEIDPIKYNLLFERFLNPERVSMPDIDIDMEDTKRDEVIKYCINKYGIKKVVPIIAFGTLASKQAIRDVGRCLDIDLSIIDYICKQIDSRLSLKENLSNKKLYDYIKMDEELDKMYEVAMKIEGLKRHTTIHAAGIIMSKVDIDEIVPLDKSHNDFYTTQYDMTYLESLGLLKMDFLAIKNLTMMHEIISDIGISLSDIKEDDKETSSIFETADTDGIFQFESEGMKNFLRKFKPSSFEDIFAAIALYRPGPMQNIDTYIKRKQGKEKIDYYHESLESILKPTYGILIYQEQIMQVASILAGYTLGQADILRKAMSKKKEDILLKEKEKFIEGCIKNNVDKDIAEKVYELILRFASYGFNRAHSVAYSNVAYKMAYLKKHYRIYFLKNLLNNYMSNEYKKKTYILDARKNNIEVVVPDINLSTTKFEVIDNKLIYPLTGISKVGINAVESIINERNKEPFKDIYDFFKRCYNKSVNKKVIENLIYAGCFNSFNINRNTLINNLDELINYSEISGGFDDEFNLKPELKEYDEIDNKELLSIEKEIFGFYFTKHPVTQYQSNIKLIDIKNYFDKNIKVVVLVDKIKEISTKNNDKMVFLTVEDEEQVIDAILFPDTYKKYPDIKVSDVLELTCKVEKRFDKYQLIVNEIKNMI